MEEENREENRRNDGKVKKKGEEMKDLKEIEKNILSSIGCCRCYMDQFLWVF